MLRLFQNTGPLSFLLLLVYTGIVHAHHIFAPPGQDNIYFSFLSDLLFVDALHVLDLPTLILGIILLVFVTATGFIVSLTMQRFKLINRPSLIPAVTYILFTSFFPALLYSVPEIMCGLIVLLILHKIFAAYNKQHSDMTYFDCGALSVIAALLYWPCIILLLYSILGLFRMRSTSFREFIIYLTGILTITFLTGTGLFWFDMLDDFLATKPFQLTFFDQPEVTFTTMRIIKLALIGLVTIMALLVYIDKMSSNLIQLRRYQVGILWLLLGGIVVAGLALPGTDSAWYILLIPASMITGYYFYHSKQTLYTESAHGVLFVATIIMQYITFV